MKKTIIIMASAAALAVGCHKSEVIGEEKMTEVFDASVETYDTKTSMTPERNIIWSAGDRIAIFQGSTSADEYVLDNSSAGKSNGRFELAQDNSTDNGDYSAPSGKPRNIAVYPFSEDLTISAIQNGSVTDRFEIGGISLPQTQEYVAGGFGNGTYPMVAVTQSLEDHSLNFKNLLGAIQLQLKGDQTVRSISIAGNDQESVWGLISVTVYTDGTTPAAKAKNYGSVTRILDCGDGVALNEDTATDFMIVLPPVVFNKGFTVTVTDIQENTYTLKTTLPNAVLRSSVLRMPAVTLGKEVSDEEYADPVEDVDIRTGLNLPPGATYTIEATLTPENASDKTLTWVSSNEAVAKVDQNGKVTAIDIGTANITAIAPGGASAFCNVHVLFQNKPTNDYVDEYGNNLGKGIPVGTTVWAPVNCGYHATRYPYGKLYQWGRKHGQGAFDDDTYPSGDDIVSGPVTYAEGSSPDNAEVFYTAAEYPWVWCSEETENLWYGENGAKTADDPCPDGWRLPTYNEMDELCCNNSDWTTNDAGQEGCWYGGLFTFTETSPKIFLPAAGHIFYDGTFLGRNRNGYYWTSYLLDDPVAAIVLFFNYADPAGSCNGCDGLVGGNSVRCVEI